jgi:hypothetical protein
MDAPDHRMVIRRVPLPGARTLTVRPVGPGDVGELASLYGRLDADARYRRFFSHYRPPAPFFERMVTITERGGAGLVAEVSDDAAGAGHLVAEASYELLPNGDGDLAITVDVRWRGWLGPYLLDALVDTAAARRVPNLEADVLLMNGPMLAVLRARGYAVLPKSDWSMIRVMIGTRGPTPTWPGPHDAARVLIEGSGGHWSGADAMEASGMAVLGCPGPSARLTRCPALDGEPCPLAAEADAIVIQRPPDTAGWDTLRAAHARLHPGVPVCVELPSGVHATAPGETALRSGGDIDVATFVRRIGLVHHDDGDDRDR